MMYFIISIIGVLVFVGLTAYDTQKIKNMYLASDSGKLIGKSCYGCANTILRLYQLIYYAFETFWSKKVIKLPTSILTSFYF